MDIEHISRRSPDIVLSVLCRLIQAPPSGPLSRQPVDRSPRVFHSATHTVVRASCFDVLSAFVESIKLFLDGSMCLAGRWPRSI